MNRKIKIVLMGTTEFAVPALECLVQAGHQIVAVVCQPDRPNRRGKKIKFLPVKEKAMALDIPVFQPERIKTEESVKYLRALEADLFVVAAYGQILSQEVLDIPPMGCLNIHGSLLPEYRGAAPIHHAIMNGCEETGVTIMKMDAGMDTGDMLAKGRVFIDERTIVGDLHDHLARLGAEILVDTIDGLLEGHIVPEKQDETKATYADKVDRETGRINWNMDMKTIVRLINGTDPFPGAFTIMDGVKMKCFLPEAIQNETVEKPGTVLCADTKEGLLVKCQDGAVSIGMIQMPGKKKMSAQDYFRGNCISLGTQFEN